MSLRANQPDGRQHYLTSQYDSRLQWLSYWEQIEAVCRFLPQKRGRILEIGPGNRTVSGYLRKEGYHVTTVDADPVLQPDVVADVTTLPNLGNFDLVLCCQVLEHLPFSEFETALSNLARMLRPGGRLILSLPYSCFYLTWSWSWFYASIFRPLYQMLGWEPLASQTIQLRIPWFFLRHPSTKAHFWEVGQRGYSKALVRRKLSRYFIWRYEKHQPLYPYHWYLIADKSRPIKTDWDRNWLWLG